MQDEEWRALSSIHLIMTVHNSLLLFLQAGPPARWDEHFLSHCAAVSQHKADNLTEDLELVIIMVMTTDALQSSQGGGG